jgi:hypothetical protein
MPWHLPIIVMFCCEAFSSLGFHAAHGDHWPLLCIVLISLSALRVAALVMRNLHPLHPKNWVLLQLHKLSSWAATEWTWMAGLRDWLKILKLGAQLTILDFKCRYPRARLAKLISENPKLRRLQINHILL